MLHAGLDLNRRRLDVCLIDDAGEGRGAHGAAAGRRHRAAARDRVIACQLVQERSTRAVQAQAGSQQAATCSTPDELKGLIEDDTR